MVAFPYLLLPSLWSSRNRAERRQRGDTARAAVFGAIALAVGGALFFGAFWLTWELEGYAELGDYLLRLGLSWLFLTFLSFLAFSGVVTALSTFFLSEDLRLLLAAPVATRRLFHARFVRTVAQASWMVVVFLAPVLAGVGLARCAPWSFYAVTILAVVPFAIIPVALGTDCNPGSSYTESLPTIVQLAVFELGLSIAEALTAVTLNPACTLGLGAEIGSLEAGKRADVVLLDAPNLLHLAYHYGVNPVRSVIKAGREVYRAGNLAAASDPPRPNTNQGNLS